MQNSICLLSEDSYIEPLFVDKDRLSRIKALLPKIEKTYQDGLPLDFCTLEYQQMPEYPFRKK